MQNGDKNLENAIMSTVAFFDIFDYPLTLVEIHKWLYLEKPEIKFSLLDILRALGSDDFKNRISTKDGFYFLAGRKEIIKIRLQRYQLAEKKFKIALKTAQLLKWFVPIKMISVCNNVGYNNGTEKSDIDFFIIVKKGRLWWSRLSITLLVTLLGVRRYGKKIINRICLSFYISEDHLDLADIALKPVDPYLIYWLATLAPIYDCGSYIKFMAANDRLRKDLPHFYDSFMNDRRFIKDNKPMSWFKNLINLTLDRFFGDWFENFARVIQLKKMKKNFSRFSSQIETGVIINDSMLKFHEADRREFYRQEWKKKLKQLNIEYV